MKIKRVIIFLVSLVFMSACTQKNADFFPVESKTSNESLNGRAIKYNILLSSAANSTDSIYSTKGAIAHLTMNDWVYTDTADENGILTFGHLAAGNIVVRIEDSLFYTYNYIINLNADTSTIFDTQNFRNISTIVRLLPKANLLSGKLSGFIQADTNLQVIGLENVARNLSIHARLSDSVQMLFAGISENQNILDAWFEFPAFFATAQSGFFTFNLPVSSQGLEWQISADAFVGGFINATGDTSIVLFSTQGTRVPVYPFSESVCKIVYSASKK